MNAWKSEAMHTKWRSSLQEFNDLVLRHQDEAFSLAYYMLGDEAQAVQVVQSAITQAYRKYKGWQNAGFRLQILRLVSAGCMRPQNLDLEVVDTTHDLSRHLQELPMQERLALVLVDVLGLNYEQAAGVLRQPARQVSKLLALGRMKLSTEVH